MDKHDATEVSDKNGYEKGYEQGVKDMAERLRRYYSRLSGKSMAAVVEYTVKVVEEELLEKGD